MGLNTEKQKNGEIKGEGGTEQRTWRGKSNPFSHFSAQFPNLEDGLFSPIIFLSFFFPFFYLFSQGIGKETDIHAPHTL